MAGVPASVGGMIAMNFGCWNKEMKDIIKSVDVFIPEKGFRTLSNKECKFGYRTSIFQHHSWIILKATFKIKEEKNSVIKNTIKSYVKSRLEKQPIRTMTFGSVFKNPQSNSAAYLIEKSGLKGYQKNNIKISNHHANFMENISNGTAQNAIDMISYIKNKIFILYKINLIPEVSIFDDK